MALGDHLLVRRSRYYWHHGIDCGDGTVIHYTGNRATGRRVTRSPLSAFAQGDKIVIRTYARRLPAAETVARAQSRVGDHRYHLMWHNCEHFASWCSTGRAASGQVRDVSAWTMHGVLVAASVTLIPPSDVTVAGATGLLLAAARRLRRRASGRLQHPGVPASQTHDPAEVVSCVGQ